MTAKQAEARQLERLREKSPSYGDVYIGANAVTAALEVFTTTEAAGVQNDGQVSGGLDTRSMILLANGARKTARIWPLVQSVRVS
jgi:hypothetical protein